MTPDGWIYEHSADGCARFVLGTVGSNPLVCFGINPSTAKPGALDPTVGRVSRFAADNGFDSWVMLNVYPQISTDPKGLDRTPRPEFTSENMWHIDRVIASRPLTLLAAWGTLITSRPYLQDLLRGILTRMSASGCDWVSLGEPTKHGHPRHPLYQPARSPLQPFDVGRYAAVARSAPRSVRSGSAVDPTREFVPESARMGHASY